MPTKTSSKTSKAGKTRKTTKPKKPSESVKTAKKGGSPASNAVMHAYRHSRGGSAPEAVDVVGRGAPVNVGLPVRPQNASTDWFTAAPSQQAMAAEPFHVMNYINRGVVFPNVPIYDNPKVFGGGQGMRRPKSKGKSKDIKDKKGGCTSCGKNQKKPAVAPARRSKKPAK
jgi:hypothetical protein